MTGAPKITVYIASYNYGAYIRQAVESVLRQTCQDFELRIYDDGSTDDTLEVLEAYREDPRVSVASQERVGLPRTARRAVSEARGEYIIRLDADDFFDESILLVLSSVLDREPDVALVFPDYYEVNEAGEPIHLVRRRRVGVESTLLDLPAHGACTMARRRCIEEVGSYRDDIECQDGYDLWIKIIARYPVRNVNLPLFYYRKHAGSLTTRPERILRTRRAIKRAFVDERDEVRSSCLVLPIRRRSPIAPDLPLRPIAGRPLMDYALRNALGSGATRVVVATEDAEIAARARSLGAEAVLRPPELAEPNQPVEPTVRFTLERLREDGFAPDLVGVYFYTSPLVSAEHLAEAFQTLIIFDADSVVSVKEQRRMLYRRGDHGLEPLIPKRALKLEREFLHEESGGIVAARTAVLEEGSLMGARLGHILLGDAEAVDIEDPFTLWIVTQLLARREGAAGEVPGGEA